MPLHEIGSETPTDCRGFLIYYIMKTFEYGAMSSKYSLKAEDKLTAYATMVCHYNTQAHLIALYEPKELVSDDSWLNPFGSISERLDEIFLKYGDMNFDQYVESNIDKIRECYITVEKVV